MLLSSLTVLIAALPLAVLGGEFPVYNGVIGGAPTNAGVNRKVSKTPTEGVVAQAGALRYVENSGVCGETPPPEVTPGLYAHRTIETTPGVYTASGYADLTSTQHMWFWFFAARNNPDTAPLTVWLNGGVSCFVHLSAATKFSTSRSPEVLL